jgi:adenosylcobinamide-GDP ribazoletransferase
MSEPSHPFLIALHRYSRIGAARRRASLAASQPAAGTAPAASSASSLPSPDPSAAPAATPEFVQAHTDPERGLPSGAVLRYLPLVGLIVALCQVLVYGLTSLLLPHAVAVLLTLAAGLVLTAAIHERGAAHWWDGASDAAPWSNHAAAAGTVGLIVLLLARFEILASVDESWLAATLVCAAGASRGLAVLGVVGGATHATVAPISRADAIVALLLGLAPAIALAAWTGDASAVLAGLGCAVVALAVLRGVSHHHPGAGSQTLSVIQQVTEVAWLIGMLAVLGVDAAELDLEDGDS